MITRQELVSIGHYGKPHGTQGEISASLSVELEGGHPLSCLVSCIDGIYVPFFIKNLRPKSSQSWLITLDGFEDKQDVAKLTNLEVFALKKDLMSLANEELTDDMIPFSYFVGWKLLLSDGTLLGTISEIEDATENVLFVVNHQATNDEYMIPTNEHFIVEINEEEQIIVMELPDGLLEINQ